MMVRGFVASGIVGGLESVRAPGLGWWAIFLEFSTRYITNLCPKRRRYRKMVSGVSSVQQNSKRICYTVHNKKRRYRKIVSGVSSVQQNSKRCAIGIVPATKSINFRVPSCELRVAKINATMTSTSLSLLP